MDDHIASNMPLASTGIPFPDHLIENPVPKTSPLALESVLDLQKFRSLVRSLDDKTKAHLNYADAMSDQLILAFSSNLRGDKSPVLSIIYSVLSSAERLLQALEDGREESELYFEKTGEIRSICLGQDGRDPETYSGSENHALVQLVEESVQKFRDFANIFWSTFAKRQISVLDMPEEVLLRICSDVQGLPFNRARQNYDTISPSDRAIRDLCSLRISHTRFRDVATEFLYSVMDVDMTEESLSRLEYISTKPSLSRSVRGVRVALNYYEQEMAEDMVRFGSYHYNLLKFELEKLEGGDSLDPQISLYDSLESYEQSMNLGYEILRVWLDVAGDITSWHSAMAQMDSAHMHYQSLYQEQQRLRHGDSFSKRVGSAIGRMPFVTTLEMADASKTRQRRPWPQMDLAFNPTDLLHNLTLPVLWADHWDSAPGCQPTRELMRIPHFVQQAGSHITNLTVDVPFPEQLNLSWMGLKESDFSDLALACRDTKAFEYWPANETWHEVDRVYYIQEYDDFADVPRLFTPLLSSQNLKSLRLHLGGFEPSDFVPPSPFLLFCKMKPAANIWCNLEILYLESASVTQDEMRIISTSIKGRLKMLSLQNISLVAGTWADVLEMWRGKCQRSSCNDFLGAECVDMTDERRVAIFGRDVNLKGKAASQNFVDQYIMQVSSVNPFLS